MSASRKVLIYLGTAISTAGTIVFFSGFVSFAKGFMELSRPRERPERPRSSLGQSFEERQRQSEQWRSQIEEESYRAEQIFSQIWTTSLPRFGVGFVLMGTGSAMTSVGKKGVLGLSEDGPTHHGIGFYVEQYFNAGGTMNNEERSIHIQASSGSNVVYAGQDISGTLTTTIQQLQQSQEPNAQQLMTLLIQLQQVIEAESALTIEDKADALEQVRVLAEASKHPEEQTTQKLARNAIKILRGTAAMLPTATDFLNACTTLLPSISQLLGLI